MKRYTLWCLLALTGLSGCDDAPTPAEPIQRWITAPEGPAPEWLSETGFYDDLATETLPADVLLFTPPNGLWTGGADKGRLLYLPPNTAIRTDTEFWQFPLGTVLAKSFSYEAVEGQPDSMNIETRLEWLTAQGWRYATYHWNAEGTEARKYPERWGDVPVELLPIDPEADPVTHTLPSELGCDACHGAPGGKVVLGIDPYNVPPELVEAGVFEPAIEPIEVVGRTPEETAAMGYFVANCGHCHHGRKGVGENASYSLLPADLVANTVNQETDSSASGDGVRVVPGDPEGSAVYQAVVHARDADYAGQLKAMPPLGIDRVDPDAAQIIGAWIESIDGLETP